MDGRTSQTHKKTAVLILLACAVVLAAFGCLMDSKDRKSVV